MNAETTAWWSDAPAGDHRQRLAPPVPLRLWHPAAEESEEFSCAYLDGRCAAPHVHEEWQFAVAAEPSTITLGAYRRYSAQPNDVTVVQPYEVHTEGGVSGEPRRWLVLYVAEAVVDRVHQDRARGVPRFGCPVISDPHSSQVLFELLQCSMSGNLDSSEFTVRVLEWLRHLFRNHALGMATPPEGRRIRAPVERARSYLQAHPTEPLPLADLVDLLGVTTSHLVRSFSRSVGLPPKSYHAQIRLARARRLLAQGKPATWVAYECGFADQSHLSRRFREYYGLTPGAFQTYYKTQKLSIDIVQPSGAHNGLGFSAA
ncbi:MAG TPA: AraC family transcriptional regulator [Gemmatimonadales bacterium]|nr:AraC family transcriptional regulator [Gemmatimonadales bacterium]